MKGNIIVGQSGGPTAAINSSLAGVYRTAIDRGAKKVYGMRHGIQGLLNEDYIDLSEHIQTDLDVELLKRTPAAYLGSCRYKLPEIHEDIATYDKIFSILDKLEIECFIYIGGNDSMDTIKKLSDYAILRGHPTKFLGVPKTIDNDLALTDHTPGYGSAAKYIGTSVKEIIQDSQALIYDKGLVTIVEIMGRHAGWLTAASRLARKYEGDNPCLIYLPETPFSLEQFYNDLDAAFKKSPNLVVCVSEGIADEGGTFVCEYSDAAKLDSFGHKMLTGCGEVLESFVRDKFGVKVRSIELNVNQRCSGMMVSETDIEEAAMAGAAGVKAVLAGETKKMIAFKRDSDMPYKMHCTPEDVSLICNQEKKFPKEWINAAGNDITDDFSAYALPLIQGEPKRVMENGVPKYLYRK